MNHTQHSGTPAVFFVVKSENCVSLVFPLTVFIANQRSLMDTGTAMFKRNKPDKKASVGGTSEAAEDVEAEQPLPSPGMPVVIRTGLITD